MVLVAVVFVWFMLNCCGEGTRMGILGGVGIFALVLSYFLGYINL